MDFAFPSHVRLECNRCGLCCGDTKQKTRHILLLEAETKRIASQTSLNIPDFSTEIRDKPPYTYEMKKTNEGKCFFLKENQCNIYPLRPLICQFYPFELKFNADKKMHIFDFTIECPGINQGKLMSEKDFRKLFERAQEKLR